MTRMSKTLFLSLAALACLLSAGTIARADDSSIIASNGIITVGAGLFVNDLYLGGSIDAGGVDFTDGSAGFVMSSGSFLIMSNNFAFTFSTNGFYNLDGGGIINTGTVIADGGSLATPEPATWLLAGLGLLVLLLTHKSRRQSV